jgi:hypothetical protein
MAWLEVGHGLKPSGQYGDMNKNRRRQPVIATDTTFALLRQVVADELDEGQRYDAAVMRRVLRVTGWDKPREESGQAAWEALVAVEQALMSHAVAVAQELSIPEWLWYLRRVEPLFRGINSIPSTAPYTAAIAESVSAISATPARPMIESGPMTLYPIDRAAGSSIWRLYTVSRRLYEIHARLRWAGKGAVIRSVEDDMPKETPTPELERMVNDWDGRMGEGAFLEHAGLYSHTLGVFPKLEHGFGLVPIVGRAGREYGLTSLNLGAVPALSDPNLPVALRWPTPVLDLIAVLWATLLNRADQTRTEQLFDTYRTKGYRSVTKELATVEIDHAVSLLGTMRLGGAIPDEVSFGSGEEILHRLTWCDVSVWPPTMGPPIRICDEDRLLVDVSAASHRLARALARPNLVGELANLWAAHFETTVQASISASPWKPSAAMAAIRRRHLGPANDPITDIDAIGEFGRQVLLVSCKCRPFDEAWDRGEYNAVRNVGSLVDGAVAEWADRVGQFRESPRGQNYDFTGRELVGVVVLPSPPWSTNPAVHVEVMPGLRASVSARELDRWINQ